MTLLLALACATDPALPSSVPGDPAALVGAGQADAPTLDAPTLDAPTLDAPTLDAPTNAVASDGLGLATDPNVPKVSTLLGDAPGVVFTGEWTSAGCGGRAYARNLRIVADGTYAAIDLMSPCPSGATCTWSGMVAFAGIWKQEGKKVLLREIGGPIARGSPHPTEIESTVDGHLVENGCLYDRGLTVPTGYTEDQVRPRVPGTY